MPTSTAKDANLILIEAAYSGDLERFDYALCQGANLQELREGLPYLSSPPLFETGKIALHAALTASWHQAKTNDHFVIVQKLLAMGVSARNGPAFNNSPLAKAVSVNDSALINLLFEHGAQLYSTTKEAIQLMQVAVFRGLTDLLLSQLEFLIAQSNEKKLVKDLEPLLIYAAMSGNQEAVVRLLEIGVDANARQSPKERSDTALMKAIERGDERIAALLRLHGARSVVVSGRGKTLLHCAAQGEMLEFARELLNAGVDPNISDSYGHTPLHYTTFNKKDDLARLLIAAGADPLAVSRDGNTILHTAARSGRKWLVEACLNLGIKVDIPDYIETTPLMGAALFGQTETMAFLAERGANINHVANVMKETPLHCAIVGKNFEAAHWLIEQGADIHIESEDDDRGYGPLPPLLNAIALDQSQIVELLLAKGADLNYRAKVENNTALHIATYANAVNCLPLLLQAGIDINITNSKNETALMLATKLGINEIALLLIQANADVNTRSTDGNTPLHMAAQFGHAGVVQQLLATGADHNTVNTKGQTPLDLAIYEGFPRVIKLLQQ